MINRLTKIGETLEVTEQAVTDFENEWPELSSDTPAKLYVRDVGFLLGFLTEHPGSEPPGDEREVLVRLGDFRRMGFFREGRWLVYGYSGVVARHPSAVDSWQELPPERDNGSQRAN